MPKPAAKPALAIDLDEVVSETAQNVLEYYNPTYGTAVELKDYYSQDPKHWNAVDMKVVSKRLNKYLDTEEYLNSKPVRGTAKALKALKKKYRLYIITGRPDFTEKVTRRWLEKHLPGVFEEVVFTSFFYDHQMKKSQISLKIGAYALVDDHIDHVKDVARSGVKCLLFGNFPWSEDKKLPAGVTRVQSWGEVLEILL